MKKRPGRQYTSREIWGYHEDTSSELKLSRALKKAGVAFEREVPIDRFTVDFLVDEWLIVEVDGWSHSHPPVSRKTGSAKLNWKAGVFGDTHSCHGDIPQGRTQAVGKQLWNCRSRARLDRRTGFEDIHLKQQVDKAA